MPVIVGQKPAGRGELIGGHVGGEGEDVVARAQRHDELLQGTVAGPLADAVDGAFHLAGAGLHGGDGVGHRQPQVVVAVDRDDGLVDVPHVLLQVGDDVEVLEGDGVADRIRDVDRGGAGIDDRLDHLGQKRQPRPHGVLAGELHVGGIGRGPLDRLDGRCQHLGRLHLQLVLHVDVGGGDKGVDAPLVPGILQRLPGPVDILVAGAAQTGDLGSLDLLGHQLDRLEIAIGSDGKAGLDHVHVHLLELFCHPQFFFDIHAVAGGLLAVPQRGVKNPDELPVILLLFFRRCLCHVSLRSFPGCTQRRRPSKVPRPVYPISVVSPCRDLYSGVVVC